MNAAARTGTQTDLYKTDTGECARNIMAQSTFVRDGAGTFWGHVEGIEADATFAVDVWVVDGRRESDLGRLKGIPVRDHNV